MKKDKYIDKAVAWAEKKATISLKAVTDGYENPKIFTNQKTKEEIQADLSFVTHGGAKHFSEVALKNDNEKKTVSKWKVLSYVAAMKKGKLHLLAPNGHKSFTQKLVNQHNINAVVHSL